MINNQTLARPYAKAAFEYASAANSSDAWSGMLSLAAAVVEAPEVAELLRNPRLTRESKVEAVLRLFAADVDEAFRNFITNMGEHDRLFVLSTVRELFEAYKAEADKTLDVELETAYELSAEQLETLAAALSKRLDRSVNPRQVVNPALIGGLVIRAGDVVVDGSVRGKLSQLAESLKS
ncbi:F0F1 ATP synthase subunit delta [Azotobacter chroococcum]|jgi:F-type H+-transporting ATPase subunit delta|uniref:ATP synthase subunit delta n=2 Tax=Azotobacter chroococcum TaxID=353 RepID=A0A0C4WWV9_9GAMM|nr:F0F1 ATP synthase subunit delta [Azotobacter chroococcum]OHC12555.1 MAG: ATP synthase F1 subunit delta [Pseudomonadales bacterium GWC1_66_9]AJE23452.1 F1 sector of membrane-bound ATP synthase, delta subunit [Azotobacter chroococcum NCIMB 8003]ASL28492.1 ATP synthase F0F1 subunit delta [Azotobacter chroococcum]QQE88801.1 F0F1 ATP synthase subunit delta [Azotobacter chroococcum]TBW10200.1 F0F1 ATP synthase subunit delta [Azotobacter chroococcum]